MQAKTGPAHTRLFRVGVLLATTSLSVSVCGIALAQPALPPGEQPPGAEQAGDQGTDPPALAGRVAAITGSVSFHAAGETQWNAATVNYPVTNGEAFWTEPQAQTTLDIADDRIVLDASTELDVAALDQSQITATEAQGAIFLQLNSLPSGQTITFTTPRGAVQITAVGRYEIVAGDTNDATTVTVVEGAAHVSGTNLALDIGPQQTAIISGSDTLQGSVGPMQQDGFLQSMLRGPSRPHFAAAVPRQVRYMTGAADLQTYGSFSQTAQYGQVWYPRDVASTWAPYRDGHWAYVQPWGWTWVDNARWGFAPFHYGRWVQVDNRWGWVAGGGDVADDSPYPVYSPALVSFVDVSGPALAGAAIGFAAGEFASGYAPAWIPLGPREPYYPWYHCRPDYFGRLNSPYGVPRTIIEQGPTYNTNITNVRVENTTRTNIFINQRAATVIPAAAFARGGSVATLGRPLPERALLQARPVIGRLPVRPTAETAHLPPAAARRYDVALPAASVRPVTAGPHISPAVPTSHAVPELRKATLPANVHAVPAAPPRPGETGTALPARGPNLAAPPNLGAASRPGQPGKPPVHPGEAGSPRGPATLPPLRAPGAARPAPPLSAPGVRPAPAASAPHGTAPDAAGRPAAPPLGNRPGSSHAPEARPGVAPVPRPPSAPSHSVAAPLPQVIRPSTPRPAEAPPRPAPVEHRAPQQAPRRQIVAAPRPAPVEHPPAPRPQPRVEAPRPMPAPHVQAPRPAPPRVEAPHSAPRIEAPRPQPHVEAPRPQPQPQHAAPPPSRPAPAANNNKHPTK